MNQAKRSWGIKVLCVLCSVLFVLQVFPHATAANIEVSADKVKVFVGSTDSMTVKEAKEYDFHQMTQLKQFSTEQPDNASPALITFNNFLSIEEAEKELASAEKIKTIYLWMPNKQGRAIIDVVNNDINFSVESFFDSLNIDEISDPVYKADMIELCENYGIFAAEVTDQNAELQANSNRRNVERVDLIYNEEAEALAVRSAKTISYACVPEKPDGTL